MKRITYYTGMLFLLLLILNSCRQEMEAISTEHSLQNRFIIERKNSAELKKNTKLTEKLQQLHPKQSLVGKYENTQFNINLNEALYIKDSSNDNHSYIFKIPNEDSNSFNLENLVLKPNSANGYDAYLVTYSLTQSERAAIENGHNIDVSQKTYIDPLDVANINISSKTGSACYELVIFGEKDCSCPEHQEWHQKKACTHPDTVYIWTMVDCGSSGGDGGGNGTPPGSGIPPGNPGSSGESSGEPDPRNTILLTPDGEIIDSPCAKAKGSTTRLNNVLKNTDIAPQIASIKNHAQNANVEYGITITRANANSPLTATAPYTDNNCCHVNVNNPNDATFIADGHSHPSASPPSVADFYNVLENAVDTNIPNFTGSFVFASNGSTFALVVTDRQAAAAFLALYPKATNYNAQTKIFNNYSDIGKDFLNIHNKILGGTFPNYSGNDQNDALETAYAYIVGKYDIGISIAKANTDGNLKPLKAVAFEYEIPASGGKKVTAYKTENCN